MKKFGNVEISKVETVRLNGRMTNVYEVRKISGKTYKDAYNAYLNAEYEA